MNFFILGSHDELSIAEIKAVLKDTLVVVAQSRQALLTQPLDPNLGELQERLAGVVKIGYVIGEMPRWSQDEAAELVAGFALEAAGKNKISFGLSVYDLDNPKRTHELEKDLDSVGLQVKRLLKEGTRPVRYVKAKEPRLSSAVVETNGLLSSGGEYVFLCAQGRTYVGKTETIQDFRAWEDRDFGRPARNAKAGMLPPKLARLMINLAGVEPANATLLDPFCGSGTILMEGILMGFKNLIGSDISNKAIDDTTQNLSWLISHLHLAQPNLSIFSCDASSIPPLPRGG
jgi:tRNA (guanine10-N2)-dimethyltransferase